MMDLVRVTLGLAVLSFVVADYAAVHILWMRNLPMPFNVNPMALFLWGLLGFIVVAPIMLAAVWCVREQSAFAGNE